MTLFDLSLRSARSPRHHTYDAAGRNTEVHNVSSIDVTLSRFNYSYDAAGNKVQVLEHSGDVVTWSYDATYQLTREHRSGIHGYDTAYTYDAAGNRTVKTDGAVRVTSVYDAANQLLTSVDSTGVTTYTHDAAGNRTVKDSPSGLTTYDWNADGRLVRIEAPGIAVTNLYNADRKRVTHDDGADQKAFLYDFEKLLAEYDPVDGDTSALYTDTLEDAYGDLVSQFRNDDNASSYYAFDGLGSTDALLDDAEVETDTWQYQAFGEINDRTGSTPNPFTFVGKFGYYENPEIDLYFLNARYYDPAAGRFLSEDPLGFDAGDNNVYRYVGNNPANDVDPSGQQYIGPEPLQTEPPRDPFRDHSGTQLVINRDGSVKCIRLDGLEQRERDALARKVLFRHGDPLPDVIRTQRELDRQWEHLKVQGNDAEFGTATSRQVELVDTATVQAMLKATPAKLYRRQGQLYYDAESHLHKVGLGRTDSVSLAEFIVFGEENGAKFGLAKTCTGSLWWKKAGFTPIESEDGGMLFADAQLSHDDALLQVFLPAWAIQRPVDNGLRTFFVSLLPFGAAALEIKENGFTFSAGVMIVTDVAMLLIPIAGWAARSGVISGRTALNVTRTAVATKYAAGTAQGGKALIDIKMDGLTWNNSGTLVDALLILLTARSDSKALRKQAEELAEELNQKLAKQLQLEGTLDSVPHNSRKRLFAKTSETGTASLPAGVGRTDKFGNVLYSTLGCPDDVALVRYHESVHSFLSPKFKLFRELRADFGIAAYNRSATLRYIEEALAESYAQLRVNGIRGLPTGIKFPIKEGYVTIQALAAEGAVGTIVIGGMTYYMFYDSE